MTIQEIENQIIDEFDNFDDWLDRYNYIIEMGKEYGLDLPLTRLNLDMLDEIQEGKRDFSVANLDILLEENQKYYQ